MSVLDWIFVTLLSFSMVFVLIGLLYLVQFFTTGRKYRNLHTKKPKNKKKRTRLKKILRSLKQKQKKNVLTMVTLYLLAAVMAGGAIYSRYYQLTTLNKEDSEIIVQSYFLVDSIDQELKAIENGADPTKVQEKLTSMVNLLASYGVHTPSNQMNEDSQRLLKRYYTNIRELGQNLSNSVKYNLNDPLKLKHSFEDIEKAGKIQKTIFTKFKINESALKTKK